ncbi:MAG: aminopeptidase N C-terminal domain-containing protein, partial [Desulfocapsa sp.]|nr:aminopeptidase N C-terminal domain-containing protein [Desulfocapsa sp.]
EILNNTESDTALLGMTLTLPEESYLAQQMDVVDPDAIHLARKFIRQELLNALRAEFRTVWGNNKSDTAYSLSPEAMGKRRLKNVCLSYLLCADTPDQADVDLALNQYQNANNMTDAITVLQALSRCDIPERLELFNDFYEKWKDDVLVMDKWLILQASSSLPSTLDSVKALMTHPAFSLSNPNKVRSLIGAFGGNHVSFHNISGKGYTFLADQIIELDSRNPQIASRLTSPFSTWKRYDTKRQDLIKVELERIAAQKNLSGDVYEMIKRNLDA